MLEADKLRLSRDLRDLRRRLREQRLSLPPEAYSALVRHEQRAATRAANGSADGISPALSPTGPNGEVNVFAQEDDLDLDEDEDAEGTYEGLPDPTYDRVSALVDALLFHGHAALQRPAPVLSPSIETKDGGKAITPSNSSAAREGGGFGPKVLSPAEVEMHYQLRRKGRGEATRTATGESYRR